MPGFDGTGPWGQGPMTGGGRGYCAVPVTRLGQPLMGRGWGRGWFGRGRGWRNRFWATGFPGWVRDNYPPGVYPYAPEMTQKQEMEMLKQEAELLKSQLEDIQDRIKELDRVENNDNTDK